MIKQFGSPGLEESKCRNCNPLNLSLDFWRSPWFFSRLLCIRKLLQSRLALVELVCDTYHSAIIFHELDSAPTLGVVVASPVTKAAGFTVEILINSTRTKLGFMRRSFKEDLAHYSKSQLYSHSKARLYQGSSSSSGSVDVIFVRLLVGAEESIGGTFDFSITQV